MAQRNLSKLYGRFSARTDRLLDEFLISPPTTLPALGPIGVDKLLQNSRGHLVNRLFHLWGGFCMSLVVASAIGGYKTLKGMFIHSAPGIRHVADIQSVIKVHSLEGPGIRWEDPKWTTQKVNLLQLANQQQILLGISSVPMDDFRRVRHFVIHPNRYTKSEFESVTRKYALFRVGADDFLLHRLPGGGTILEEWVQQFQIAAYNAVK